MDKVINYINRLRNIVTNYEISFEKRGYGYGIIVFSENEERVSFSYSIKSADVLSKLIGFRKKDEILIQDFTHEIEDNEVEFNKYHIKKLIKYQEFITFEETFRDRMSEYYRQNFSDEVDISTQIDKLSN